MTDTTSKRWLAPLGAALSLIACYGTLAAIALLGALGVGIALNEAVWAGAIVMFAALAVGALALRWRRHGRGLPVLLGGAGLALIAFAMYVSYSLPAELGGLCSPVPRDLCRLARRSGMSDAALPPLLRDKDHGGPSAFTPESLLREARRQKGAEAVAVPEICLLDPDGDIVRALCSEGRARRHAGWVCYHTEMWVFDLDGQEVGVVGCAVGASFAVLVAEEMFASGCQLLISVTSSGQIMPQGATPYFIVIDRAWRDEGTSYHYLPPSDWSPAPEHLLSRLSGAFKDGPRVLTGPTWTTDAPFRETDAAIAAARARGILAVEMEAAALYAFARARDRAVICLAHVTNQMGTVEGDFEKGAANGSDDALVVVSQIVDRLG